MHVIYIYSWYASSIVTSLKSQINIIMTVGMMSDESFHVHTWCMYVHVVFMRVKLNASTKHVIRINRLKAYDRMWKRQSLSLSCFWMSPEKITSNGNVYKLNSCDQSNWWINIYMTNGRMLLLLFIFVK